MERPAIVNAVFSRLVPLRCSLYSSKVFVIEELLYSIKKIVIMYIYHALINALSTYMIHINLNMKFCTHAEHSPTQKFT